MSKTWVARGENEAADSPERGARSVSHFGSRLFGNFVYEMPIVGMSSMEVSTVISITRGGSRNF